MASHIWWRTIQIVREETRCRHMDYSFRLATRVILYAPSHRKDNTYHVLYYTSRGALAWTIKIAQWVHHVGSIRRPIASWTNALTTELHLAPPVREDHITEWWMTIKRRIAAPEGVLVTNNHVKGVILSKLLWIWVTFPSDRVEERPTRWLGSSKIRGTISYI